MQAYIWQVQQQEWIPCQAWNPKDRALNYGDGLFETFRFNNAGHAPLWSLHQQRLAEGLHALLFPSSSLASISRAFQALPHTLRQGGGKLLVSRGSGPRGYAIPEQIDIQILWQPLAPSHWAVERFPQGFHAEFSAITLARQPHLAGIKHLNRLEQVLIRSQFPPSCQEMVVCDALGFVIEGAMSNIFALKKGRLYTPELQHCGVNGVVRRWLMQHYTVNEAPMSAEDLLQSEAIFFTNTLNGIVPVARLGERIFNPEYSGWQLILQLQRALETEFC